MDYYNLLEINKTASQEEIKKAYKRAAMKNHPDRGGDTNKFTEIQQAYETLSDPQRKQMYDQYGTDDPQKMGGFGQGGFDPFGGGGFNDMFSSMFGQGFRNQVRRNRDIQVVADVTLEEVLTGKNIPLNFRTSTGKTENITVDIPVGIEPGQTVRYKGLGDDQISNMPRGDLLVKVRVIRHPIWEREGSNLYREIDVDVFDLILGVDKEVKMLDGRTINLNIPAGTKVGAKFSVPNYGMLHRRTNHKGKAFIIVRANIPTIQDENIRQQLESVKDSIAKLSR